MYPPLILICMISMIKDGYEDYMHYKSDNEENHRKVDVVNDKGDLESKNWEDLRVGEIIKIEENEFCPADVMVLTTSDEKGF